MIEKQILEYAKSQLALGVSSDALRSALVQAGWPDADVEDTLKSVAGEPASGAGPGMAGVAQTIKVSDLISSSESVSFSAAPSAAKVTEKAEKKPEGKPKDGFSLKGIFAKKEAERNKKEDTKPKSEEKSPVSVSVPGGAAVPASKDFSAGGGSVVGRRLSKEMIFVAAGVVFALAAAGAAFYFYSGNRSIQDRAQALGAATDQLSSKISGLNAQVQLLSGSKTDLGNQVASLTAENALLKSEISFFAAAASGTAAAPFSIGGTVSDGGKLPYVITTADGVKLSVKNSKDAKVDAALKPLVGATAQFSGTYIPGTPSVNISAVNGSSL